jgi:hypothetical protein
MKTNKAVLTATALTLMTATSLFAQPAQRGNNNSNNNNRGRVEQRGNNNDNRSYRDNDRVNSTGRVTQLKQERDGYRVQLDNQRNSYWIPASHMRNRRNDLRVGVSIVLGGVFRGGRIDVDNIGWPDDRGYNDNSVRGTVERIDRRDGVLILRESRGGRTIEVDMTDTRRSSRVDFADLRRGDYVELSGDWSRNGLFVADAIESVR